MSAGGGKNFVLMVKPVGAACNMRCSYCYYLKTQGSAPGGSVMTDETLEELIRAHRSAANIEAAAKVRVAETQPKRGSEMAMGVAKRPVGRKAVIHKPE